MNGHAQERPVRQEEDRVPARLLALVLLGAFALGAALVFWAWLELQADQHALGRRTTKWVVVPVGPAVIGGVNQTLVNVDSTTQRLRERKQQQLESWGWVDRGRGIIRIPIELAMQAVVEGTAR